MTATRARTFKIKVASQKQEIDVQEALTRALHDNPIPLNEQKWNFDLYRPTRDALELILPRCTKGTVLAFDEIHDHVYPGETQAVMEGLGLGRYPLKRNPYYVTSNYCIIE